MSYKPGKVTKLNYLGQVSVDTAHHIITHIQAFHADKGDGQCLPQVLKSLVDGLAENGLTIDEVIADTGYSSEASLSALVDHHIYPMHQDISKTEMALPMMPETIVIAVQMANALPFVT